MRNGTNAPRTGQQGPAGQPARHVAVRARREERPSGQLGESDLRKRGGPRRLSVARSAFVVEENASRQALEIRG